MPPLSPPPTSDTFRELYLHAFAPHGTVWQHVRTQAPGDVGRIDDILDTWDAAQERVAALLAEPLGPPAPDAVGELPDEVSARVAELVADPAFEQTFSLVPSRVALVELDRLVAVQRVVDLDFVDLLTASLPPHIGIGDLVELCLAPEGTGHSLRHLELPDNSHVFTSPDPGLRVLGSFVRDLRPDDDGPVLGGVPAAAVVTYIGFGVAAMNALEVGDRLILNNGFHRAFALRSMGVRHAPMVLQRIRHPEIELPPTIAGIPRSELIDRPRPVLLRDFFDPVLTTILQVERRRKLVSLRLETTQHDIPG